MIELSTRDGALIDTATSLLAAALSRFDLDDSRRLVREVQDDAITTEAAAGKSGRELAVAVRARILSSIERLPV